MAKKKSLYPLFLQLFGRISKRRRFIIAATLLSGTVLFSTFFSFDEAFYFLILIVIMTYAATFFAILEGISGKEWLMLFIPSLYFTIVFYLFYFFLPQRWLTRLPFITIYAIFIYAILLSQNIFNVGATKSLQLFRAAFSVNYLLLTLSAFLNFSLILSFKLNFFLNFLMVFASTFPLILHFLWSVNPKDSIEKHIVQYSLLVSCMIGEAGAIFSFAPIDSPIFALLLTAVFYSIGGIFQSYLQERLFVERIREYLFVLGFVSVIVLLSLK